jgi:hypothetical protein
MRDDIVKTFEIQDTPSKATEALPNGPDTAELETKTEALDLAGQPQSLI